MIIKAIKSTGLSIALAATFLVAAVGSSAFAQDWRGHDRDRDGWQDNRRERGDWQDNHRERFEERRGYHDGLMRDREDAFEHRRFNRFGYPRYRFGGGEYREGLRSECDHGHRRFADDYGHRYGRGY